ncbi:uncharacterized protein LTR77_004927 [Saxophila tyrrhenica]|uniref:Uncharacterized protein n=1 Tax=Saxophila tyrrhenica TaxID=1690608 RepID=A0AAV9PEN1_9PEZI|nr:hypothetical protein LTR77_004927 [Saxophila tyrrhenica]
MEASIPLEDVPECESLQAYDNVDGYRQFSGSAFITDKRVLSIELGAVFGDAYTYTIPHLLWAMNRAASGGVNQFIIHGQQYAGEYPETTWPGYVSFGYAVSDQYSNKRPDWNHGLEAGLRYMGRIMYVQQQGVPRIDVAFYNRQSATDPIVQTLYQPSDLEDQGWTYAYLSPTNFKLPQAHVHDGVLAPDGPSFKAMVVESSQNMTLDGVEALIDYAAAGLPIILSGGAPGYHPYGNESDRMQVEHKISRLRATSNVFSVSKGQAAQQLRALGLSPRVAIQTNGTWYPSWREEDGSGIDYAYVFCDTNASTGSITVSSVKKAFLLDAWTGEIKPLPLYEQDDSFTTIPLNLAGNETAIFAFTDAIPEGWPKAPPLHLVDVTSAVLGCKYTSSVDLDLHVPALSQPGSATLSNGSSIPIDSSDVPATIPLTQWTLTAEHWAAPSNFNDSSIVARKFNTTHELTSLVSWLDIPALANVSGIGYYSTRFTWPPQGPSDDSELGAYISFSKILDAITVYVNGQRLPPLDYNNAKKDISAYLQAGENEVLAVVPTTMWNYIQTILPRIRNAGEAVEFSGGPFGSPSEPSDNGLVGTAEVVPYRTLTIS